MTAADILAALAVLTLPVPVTILTRRRKAIRRATLRARCRRDWARDEYAAAAVAWHRARIDYRAARRDAIREYHRRNAARWYRVTLRILTGK